MSFRIPFNKSFETGRELKYVADVLKNQSTSGDGVYSRKCQDLMQQVFSVRKVLLTTSCTSALEMSVLLCDLRPGDEVILPSFTFVSTANALVLHGVTPRFVDIREDTKNLDEKLIDEAISERTKAILPVHYAGVSCEMSAIARIADTHNLRVIEDAAQAVNATYEGQYLGTLGDLGSYSFHETKNYASGEGGALLINDAGLVERAEILREKGTDRSRFFRGEVDKYTWVDLGSSYLPSDLQAAYLYAQLEARESILAKRRRIWNTYESELGEWVRSHDLRTPTVPEHCEHPFHLFYLLLPSPAQREKLIDYLKSRGILSVFHYLPLHLSPMGIRLGGKPGDCPVAESVSDRLLRLPFYNSLTIEEQREVIAALRNAPL